MKRKLMKCILPILFLAGLSLLLYPMISNEWNEYRQGKLISAYEETVSQQSIEGMVDYAGERAEAVEYNEALQPYVLPDSFAAAASQEEPDEAYLSCLNLTGDGMMGYVQIPKIDVKIPVFHTTDEAVLQTAAGHLEGSSLPVGGLGSHAVISAHRGLPSAALFTDLDQLEEGDIFLLYILDDVLCYQVDGISVVEPSDTGNLAAEEDKDLVTLMTCTPYGVNSHRLLVRGERVEYEEIEEAAVAAAAFTGPSVHTNYPLWVEVGLAVTGGAILLLYLFDRRRQRSLRLPVGGMGDYPEKKEKEASALVEEQEAQDAAEALRDSGDGGAGPAPEEGSTAREEMLEWRDDWPTGDPEGWRDDWVVSSSL